MKKFQNNPGQVVIYVIFEVFSGLRCQKRKVIQLSGRSGGHFSGQVANFQTSSNIPCSNIQSGLQHFLPEDIAVVEATEVNEDFHATYSATSKWYRYVIHNADSPNPFIRRFAWQYASALDVVAMHQAAQLLVGTHDFRAFETQFPNRASSDRIAAGSMPDSRSASHESEPNRLESLPSLPTSSAVWPRLGKLSTTEQ